LKPHNGYQLVQDDFKLAVGADIVADPSAPDAFVEGIMENYDWWLDSATGNWQKRYIEESRTKLKTFSKRQIEEKALTILERYLKSF
jgi:outer membrane protease